MESEREPHASAAGGERARASLASDTRTHASHASVEREGSEREAHESVESEPRKQGVHAIEEGDARTHGERAGFAGEPLTQGEEASHARSPRLRVSSRDLNRAIERIRPKERPPAKVALNTRIDPALSDTLNRVARQKGGYGSITRAVEFCLTIGLPLYEQAADEV